MPHLQELSPDPRDVVSDPLLSRLTAPHGAADFPRLLLVFAHPDDETLALGARLEHLRGSRLLTLTDGAPADGGDARDHGFATLEAYRQARRDELLCALNKAGLDVAFAPAFHEQVPDQTASLHLAKLTRRVAQEIVAFRPEALLTHPYEGGHPDHDACAFAVHMAVRLAAHASGQPQVPVLEAPFYHLSETGSMQTGTFLHDGPQTVERELSSEERRNKQERLSCFASQAQTLAQFATDRESFRLAPRYDFSAPPHAGELLYERFQWGMTGEHFRRLVTEVCEELAMSLPKNNEEHITA